MTGPWWADWSVWRWEREGAEWVFWQPSPGWTGTPMAWRGNMAGGLRRKRERSLGGRRESREREDVPSGEQD